MEVYVFENANLYGGILPKYLHSGSPSAAFPYRQRVAQWIAGNVIAELKSALVQGSRPRSKQQTIPSQR